MFATKLKTPVSLDGYGDMVVQTGLDVDYSTFKDNFNEGTEITGKTLDQTQIAVFGESEYFINENWIATLGARVHWSDIFDFHFAPRAYLVWKLLRPSALRAAWPTVMYARSSSADGRRLQRIGSWGSQSHVRQSRSEARRKLELRIVVNREARSGCFGDSGCFLYGFQKQD